MPHEFVGGSYNDVPAYKYRDELVAAEHLLTKRWPGPHKNVSFWVELANGRAVGWNENPAIGWSFPVVKLKTK